MILYKDSKPLNGKSIHYIIQFRYKIIILILQNSTCAILYLLIHSYGTPDCKVQGSNLSGKKCCLIVSKLWYIIWRGVGCKQENLLRQPPTPPHSASPTSYELSWTPCLYFQVSEKNANNELTFCRKTLLGWKPFLSS